MDEDEIRLLVALEDEHWWYRARRRLIRNTPGTTPGGGRVAVDVGAAGGGHTRLLPLGGRRGVSFLVTASAPADKPLGRQPAVVAAV